MIPSPPAERGGTHYANNTNMKTSDTPFLRWPPILPTPPFFGKLWKLNSPPPPTFKKGGPTILFFQIGHLRLEIPLSLSVAFDHALFEYSLIGSYNQSLQNLFLGKFSLLWLWYTRNCPLILSFLSMSSSISFRFFLFRDLFYCSNIPYLRYR